MSGWKHYLRNHSCWKILYAFCSSWCWQRCMKLVCISYSFVQERIIMPGHWLKCKKSHSLKREHYKIKRRKWKLSLIKEVPPTSFHLFKFHFDTGLTFDLAVFCKIVCSSEDASVLKLKLVPKAKVDEIRGLVLQKHEQISYLYNSHSNLAFHTRQIFIANLNEMAEDVAHV